MRKPSACNACRSRRRRCTFSRAPGTDNGYITTCDYCISRGLKCVQAPPEGGYYAQRQARVEERKLSLTSADGLTHQHVVELPPMKLRLELVDLYFQYIHDQFHSLFHRPTFTEEVAQEQVPEVILFAIFALSARFSTHESFSESDPRHRGLTYRKTSEKLLDIRDFSLTTIQAFILLGSYAAAEGETDVENVYYNMAGRLALVTDLPNQQAPTALKREINIRTWWTLCMVDVWSSTAVNLPRIMPLESNNVPLPLEEVQFLAIRPEFLTIQPSATTFATPLMSEMIRLNRLLSKIIDLNKKCVTEGLQGPSLEAGVQLISAQLDEWMNTLSHSMQDTQDNLEWFASHGLGRVFAAVYLGYYHYGALLNYQFLGADSSAFSTPTVTGYAHRCKDHAARLCDLVYRAYATPGCKVMYSAVAHVLVIASTVQIHTLLFSGDDTEINMAKARLERNFEVLLELRPYWTSVDGAMNRLQVFHQTCLRSKDKSFVLDRWLLRFLVEFAAHMEFESRDSDESYHELMSLSKLKSDPGNVR